MIADIRADLVLEHYLELANCKPINKRVAFCTCFSMTNSFVVMAKLLLFSIIKHEPELPIFHVVYNGNEYPEFLEKFRFVEARPMLWQLKDRTNKSQPLYNFCGKTQAMLGVDADITCWLDADIMLMAPLAHRVKKSTFIEKRNRYAGGFWCLARHDKAPFMAKYLDLFAKNPRAKSDQKMIKWAAKEIVDKDLWKSCGKESFSQDGLFVHADKSHAGRQWFIDEYRNFVDKEILSI